MFPGFLRAHHNHKSEIISTYQLMHCWYLVLVSDPESKVQGFQCNARGCAFFRNTNDHRKPFQKGLTKDALPEDHRSLPCVNCNAWLLKTLYIILYIPQCDFVKVLLVFPLWLHNQGKLWQGVAVHPVGLEPTTCNLEGCHSIHAELRMPFKTDVHCFAVMPCAWSRGPVWRIGIKFFLITLTGWLPS